jgi:hypothetical protein
MKFIIDGRGERERVGEETNQTTARKPGSLYIIQCSLIQSCFSCGLRGGHQHWLEYIYEVIKLYMYTGSRH